jgi:hypothetical protein
MIASGLLIFNGLLIFRVGTHGSPACPDTKRERFLLSPGFGGPVHVDVRQRQLEAQQG